MLRLRARAPATLSLARLVTVRRLATSASEPSTALQVTDPLALYRYMVSAGEIRQDEEQLRALVKIRKLHQELLDYTPPITLLTLLESLRPTNDPLAGKIPDWPFQRSPLSSVGTGLLPEEEDERERLLAMSEKTRSTELVKVLKENQGLEDLDTPRGFLLTGPPGTGKSLLMDLFHQSLPVPNKLRIHYHAFLLSIYHSVHKALEKQRLDYEAEEKLMNELSESGEAGYPWSRREEMKALALSKGWRAVFAGGRSPYDPDLNTREFVLAGVARDLIKTHGWLLAFDEVQLVDIAGAGLVARVLSWYWRLGGVVVGSSNRLPEDLYNSGVQRDTLNPFLNALAARSPVIELRSANDYRRVQRQRDALNASADRPAGDFGEVEAWKRWGSAAKGWFMKGEEEAFAAAVERIVGKETGGSVELKIYGRKVTVPWAYKGVARFTFKQLCQTALGAADYISIGSHFHTIILTDVPILPLSAKNEARRLITLLDALYETKTRILVSAETHVDSLFFPDAVPTSRAPQLFAQSSPDDITTSGGSDHPFSSEKIYNADASMPHASHSAGAVDPAGEIGDSLTQEMLGDVYQDLDAPYRPNISSYDSSEEIKQYARDDARLDKLKPLTAQTQPVTGSTPHPSASTPSFQSLAIFTGEEERFAYQRAVSRVMEMSSAEYSNRAVHTPLNAAFRTWEKPAKAETTATDSVRQQKPARHSVGPAVPLSEEKLSGVLSPSSLRLRYPDGIPVLANQVEVSREPKPKRGTKYDILNMEDTRREAPPPELKNVHVWGVREDWGPSAGPWGAGASVYEGEQPGRDKLKGGQEEVGRDAKRKH